MVFFLFSFVCSAVLSSLFTLLYLMFMFMVVKRLFCFIHCLFFLVSCFGFFVCVEVLVGWLVGTLFVCL